MEASSAVVRQSRFATTRRKLRRICTAPDAGLDAASSAVSTLRCSDVYTIHCAKPCGAFLFIFTQIIATHSTFRTATFAL